MRTLLTLACFIGALSLTHAASINPIIDFTDASVWAGADGNSTFSAEGLTLTATHGASFISSPATPGDDDANLNFAKKAGIGIEGGRVGFEIDSLDDRNELLQVSFEEEMILHGVYLGWFFAGEFEHGAIDIELANGTTHTYDFHTSGSGGAPTEYIHAPADIDYIGDHVTVGDDSQTVRHIYHLTFDELGYDNVVGLGFYAYGGSDYGPNDVGEYSLVGIDAIPTPEPGVLALLGLGAAGMAAVRRRRQA